MLRLARYISSAAWFIPFLGLARMSPRHSISEVWMPEAAMTCVAGWRLVGVLVSRHPKPLFSDVGDMHTLLFGRLRARSASFLGRRTVSHNCCVLCADESKQPKTITRSKRPTITITRSKRPTENGRIPDVLTTYSSKRPLQYRMQHTAPTPNSRIFRTKYAHGAHGQLETVYDDLSPTRQCDVVHSCRSSLRADFVSRFSVDAVFGSTVCVSYALYRTRILLYGKDPQETWPEKYVEL